MNNSDENLAILQPSQWINIGWFILPVVTLVVPPLAIIALIVALYKYYEVATWKYEINMRTIQEKKGVFSVTTEEIQYYRIKSIMVEEPLWMRFFGLAIVRIVSSEQFKPHLVLYAVRGGDNIKSVVSEHAYQWRKELGIRDYDVYNS